MNIPKLVLSKATRYDEIKHRYQVWKNGLISKDGLVEQISNIIDCQEGGGVGMAKKKVPQGAELAKAVKNEIVEWVKDELLKKIDHLSDIEYYLDIQAKCAGEFGDDEAYDRIKGKSDQVGYFMAMLDNFSERFLKEFAKE